MNAKPQPRKLTEDEYLSIEREADFRSEFYAGEMFAMAGGSPAHNMIRCDFAREPAVKVILFSGRGSKTKAPVIPGLAR